MSGETCRSHLCQDGREGKEVVETLNWSLDGVIGWMRATTEAQCQQDRGTNDGVLIWCWEVAAFQGYQGCVSSDHTRS